MKKSELSFTLFSVSGKLALAAALLGLCALARALTICPQCGVEAPSDSANFCAHCGARLQGGGAASSSPAEPPAPSHAHEAHEAHGTAPAAPLSATAVSSASAEAAKACVLRARGIREEGHSGAAAILLENALALASVFPGTFDDAQGKKALEERRACEQTLSTVPAACTACKGSGKRAVRMSGLSTAGTTATTTVEGGAPCPVCRGAGRIVRPRTVDERKTLMGKERQYAVQAFQSMSLVAEGNAWIPQSLSDALDVRQRARLRVAAASPCPVCVGLGLEDCKKCGATGRIPCKAKGCEDGFVVEESLNTLDSKSSAIKTRKPCPVCQGSGEVACPTCSGRGAVACKKCEGTGERSSCRSCGGEGVDVCQSCKGTGKMKASAKDAEPGDCPVCGGTGVDFCRTCRGDGRGLR